MSKKIVYILFSSILLVIIIESVLIFFPRLGSFLFPKQSAIITQKKEPVAYHVEEKKFETVVCSDIVSDHMLFICLGV